MLFVVQASHSDMYSDSGEDSITVSHQDLFGLFGLESVAAAAFPTSGRAPVSMGGMRAVVWECAFKPWDRYPASRSLFNNRSR